MLRTSDVYQIVAIVLLTDAAEYMLLARDWNLQLVLDRCQLRHLDLFLALLLVISHSIFQLGEVPHPPLVKLVRSVAALLVLLVCLKDADAHRNVQPERRDHWDLYVHVLCFLLHAKVRVHVDGHFEIVLL